MLTEVYSEADDRLDLYMANNRIQDEDGEVTDYDGWLEGCEKFLEDNRSVLKEWMLYNTH